MYNECMKRINLYVTLKQWKFLKDLNGLSLSEHIRRAIDEYIAKFRKETE